MSSKSILGVLLAKALGMDFIDTDIVIQQHDGRLLQIIDNDGIKIFMEVEESRVLIEKLHYIYMWKCYIFRKGYERP